MTIIAVPTRIPRATSLGTLAGITNTNRLNRLTRMAIINWPPILGKLVKVAKTVKLVGARENGKMRKPGGPKIGAIGKMVKLTSATEW